MAQAPVLKSKVSAAAQLTDLLRSEHEVDMEILADTYKIIAYAPDEKTLLWVNKNTVAIKWRKSCSLCGMTFYYGPKYGNTLSYGLPNPCLECRKITYTKKYK